jgi:tripeptidyl-peptidase-1
MACSDYGGGGFSVRASNSVRYEERTDLVPLKNYFERPAYQQHGVVDAYIKSLDGKYDGRYNKEGRGYPDVAAHGDRMVEVQAGKVTIVGGTSASTPIFVRLPRPRMTLTNHGLRYVKAGVISLLNDALLAKCEPPLGFLNPWIYSVGYKALTDIIDKTTYGGE